MDFFLFFLTNALFCYTKYLFFGESNFPYTKLVSRPKSLSFVVLIKKYPIQGFSTFIQYVRKIRAEQSIRRFNPRNAYYRVIVYFRKNWPKIFRCHGSAGTPIHCCGTLSYFAQGFRVDQYPTPHIKKSRATTTTLPFLSAFALCFANLWATL